MIAPPRLKRPRKRDKYQRVVQSMKHELFHSTIKRKEITNDR